MLLVLLTTSLVQNAKAVRTNTPPRTAPQSTTAHATPAVHAPVVPSTDPPRVLTLASLPPPTMPLALHAQLVQPTFTPLGDVMALWTGPA